MEQIAKLLFAATILTIFVVVLMLTSTGLAGNGGEYWGYNGGLDASDAARLAFDAEDYRYLEVDLTDSNGIRTRSTPMFSRCHDHPFGTEFVTRRSGNELVHGYDSVRLASEFAEQYNNSINDFLERELKVYCGDYKQSSE